MSRRLLLVGALLLLEGCAVVTLATKRRGWPDPVGTTAAPHLERPVSIAFDERAIPHVRAETELDGWYAVGFLHGRDRLFQADIGRRLAYGRLSEWLGEDTVALDGFIGSFRLRDRAETTMAELDPAVLAAIDVYVAGLNDAIAAAKVPPVEYRLLGVTPEPWSREDVAALLWLQSLNLSENLDVELAALTLRGHDAATLDALLRIDPAEPPVDAYWDDLRAAEIGDWGAGFSSFMSAVGSWGDDPAASNNWVVGPALSADGRPIVANDPHLVQSVPSLWYAVELRAGDVHVAGVTLPGTPFVVIGHNERTAWGLTNLMADMVDLPVMERRGARDYVLAGEVRTLEDVRVPVRVKGGATVDVIVPWTDVGPVLTEGGTHVVAMRWHALEVADRTPEIFHGLARAASVDEALAAADRPSIVAQNLVVADVDGSFAWQVFGSLVRRKAHTGRVPYPASDPAHGWDGWLDHKPGERDPERGFVLSANSRPDDPDAFAITARYLPDWRRQRIEQLLSARQTHTPETLAAIQLDRMDLHAKALLPALLEGVPGTSPDAKRCRELLLSWDFRADTHSSGAAVWYPFQRELLRVALADELGDDLATYLAVASPGRSVLDGQLDRFVDDRPAAVEEALGSTCRLLADELGPDPATWAWGRLHPLSIEHPFAGDRKLLRRWNLGTVPYGGATNTVNQAGFRWAAPDLATTWIASSRLITPLSDPGRGTVVYPGGQSGHPRHPHSQDLTGTYLSGQSVPLWFDDEDVAAHAQDVLELVPGDGRGFGSVHQAGGI